MDRSREEDLMYKIVSQIPFGILTFGANGNILTLNRQAKELLSLKREVEDLIGTSIFSLTRIDKLNNVVNRMITGTRKSFNLQRIPIDDRYLNIIGRKLPETNLITIIDSTANVKAMDKATQNLLLGQEQERARLAREIHDGVGPMMSSIRLHIDALRNLSSNDKVTSKLEMINEMITEVSRDIRQISHDLMPSSLRDFGLSTAIENFVKRINERDDYDFQIYYSQRLGEMTLSHEREINVFRMVQELVNNAIKYSGGTEIHIQLTKFDNSLQVTVEDNGKGANKKEISTGMGLNNIVTRVKSLHGTFDLETEVGEGFLAQIIIPIA